MFDRLKKKFKKQKIKSTFFKIRKKSLRGLESITGKEFIKKRKKRPFDKVGTMGQPLTDDYGVPINPNHPNKKRNKIKKPGSRKLDYWANKKYKKDYDELNDKQKKSVKRRVRMSKFFTPKKRGRR